MRTVCARALVALLVMAMSAASGRAQNTGPAVADTPEIDQSPPITVLEESKVDEIVDLLMTSFAADLAMHVAIRGSECTVAEPRCAPLFFAQDVILGPWNFIRLLKVTHEQQDPDPSIFQARDFKTPVLHAAGVLPPGMVSLAEYAMEQQTVLYESLEAWQVTRDRLHAALVRNDEQAVSAQRSALAAYSTRVSTAAAGASASSVQFLESLTPLVPHFASAISVEEEQAARDDLRDNGFGPNLMERFSTFRIGQADTEALRDEIFAAVGDAPVDLIEGLTGIARGYDRLADLTAVSVDSSPNARPLASAGVNQALPSGDRDEATVVLNGSASNDPEGGALQHLWTAGAMTFVGAKVAITLPIGIHHIALTVSDEKGGTDVDLVTITVSDAAAPRITRLTATPEVLSPANRELVPVVVDVKVVDNDDPAPFCQVVSVGINEAANDASDAATLPDVVLDGSLRVLLRAERSGGTANRVYAVTVQCTDKTNHSSLGSVFVSVPR